MTSDFSVKIVTWNVAEEGPPKDFTRLLGLDAKELPDLYALGFQELKTFPMSIVSDALKDDPWTLAIAEQLTPRQYVRIKSVRMMGIHLSIYTKRKHLNYICNVESEYNRTGSWGIKGGVSIRLDLYGVNVCFVNCHFSAHLPKFAERLQDYDEVLESHEFKDDHCTSILDHDYVFWLGDLNFRLEQFSKKEIEDQVTERDYDVLLRCDQLVRAMENELILVDFKEGPITFPPSYKFNKNTSQYDSSAKQRKPAWCDRILWQVNEDAFEGADLSVQQLAYTSLMEYMTSDHKPVTADFVLQVLSYPDVLPVMFEPLDWCCSKDGACSYTVSKNLVTSRWDWIGLYKESFEHTKDYVTYVWAPSEGEIDPQDGCTIYKVVFDKNYTKDSVGKHRLGYFSNKKNCLMGFSDEFKISLVEDDSDSDEDLPRVKKNQ